MNGRIKILSTEVANQIAAGEVIEKPASVVKELLENAFDAGANAITIDISCGGLTSIKVSDNGTGIIEEDLPLTIAAHATSKIEQLHDLYSIASMGFRGEALASIASIAKISIRSKTAEQDHAMMLSAENGKINLSPCARSTGTTIEVRDLFYNVPVRKRFLKTERLEFLAIEAVVRRFAMSAPHIAISLAHNGRKIFDLPLAQGEQSQFKRMSKLFGAGFTKDAIHLNVERSGLHLQGWISGPNYQRSQNDRLWVYINQRMVKDKLIHHAIKQVYEGLIHQGRFPACLLYLDLPAHEVDVNVHPAKHELRFQQPRLIHDFFTSQLSKALSISKQSKEIDEEDDAIYSVRPLQIAEPSQPVPYRTSENDSSWICLNKQFVFIQIENCPCLVDAKKLYQHWLYTQLKTQPKPLANRLLLVPVSYQVDSERLKLIIANKAIFNEVGIEIDKKTANQLLVKTLPVLGSQLNFSQMLQTLQEEDIDYHKLLLKIAQCQSFDAYQLSVEEKKELKAFLLTLDSQAAQLTCCKPLDEQQYRVIFGE